LKYYCQMHCNMGTFTWYCIVYLPVQILHRWLASTCGCPAPVMDKYETSSIHTNAINIIPSIRNTCILW
jgi:hypothetical protein